MICTICRRSFNPEENMYRNLRIEWSTSHTGRYIDETCCNSCYSKLSYEFEKLIKEEKLKTCERN